MSLRITYVFTYFTMYYPIGIPQYTECYPHNQLTVSVMIFVQLYPSITGNAYLMYRVFMPKTGYYTG